MELLLCKTYTEGKTKLLSIWEMTSIQLIYKSIEKLIYKDGMLKVYKWLFKIQKCLKADLDWQYGLQRTIE